MIGNFLTCQINQILTMSESKDFTQFLNQNHTENDQQSKLIAHINTSMNSSLHSKDTQQKIQQSFIPTFWKEKIAAYVSPFVLSMITGPLSTVSILLQVTEKPIVNTIELKTKNQTGGMLKLIQQGVLGDNTIYKAMKINNYNDAFKKLGKQGIRGFYKGIFTGLLLSGLNSKIKAQSYELVTLKSNENQYITNAFAIGISTLADLLTLPLLFCQSRLVLQNSLPNFRTYRHFWNVLSKTSIKMWFAGSSLLLVKNTISTLSWLQLIKESPVYSFIISTILSHLVTYPFLTIIRNLQCNDLNAPMMQRRKENVRQCIRRINQNGGIKAFYRGFLAYGLVHTFLGSMMIEMNMRSGYFQMMQ